MIRSTTPRDVEALPSTTLAPPSPLSALPTLAVFSGDRDEAAMFERLAPEHGVRVELIDAALSASTAELARGCRCVSVDHRTPVTAAALDALAAAGVVHLTTRSVGVDHIDVDHARTVGIAVDNVPYEPDGVADFTVMLIPMALRAAAPMIHRIDAQDFRLPVARGRELRELTVGVVGVGRIGAAVVDRLAGFGCRLLVHDRRAAPLPLDDLLAASDVVTLHTPLTPDTHHLLDRRRIALLKPGAVVVNTGRGALVDSAALLAALEDGHVSAAALDVVEGEGGVFGADRRADPVSDPVLAGLLALPQVVVSPHSAFHTDRALRDTVTTSLRICRGHGNHGNGEHHG